MKKKALVVVAHPDDETIWMGGMILNSKDIDWTIFSLCRSEDPDRAPKFKKVCEQYGAKSLMSDLEDEGIMDTEQSIPEIKKRILKNFAGKKFAYIFTHGYNGEYGHERHLGVHLAIKDLIKKKQIACDNLFFFAYYGAESNFSFNLNQNLLKSKKNVIEKLYGFKRNSFEWLNCLPKETYENLNFS